MIANDEIGKIPAEFDNFLTIFSIFLVINVHKGNKFILSTYEPTQLQQIIGRPFLVYPCVIPCYKIILIKNSVHAQDDNFQDSTDW